MKSEKDLRKLNKDFKLTVLRHHSGTGMVTGSYIDADGEHHEVRELAESPKDVERATEIVLTECTKRLGS